MNLIQVEQARDMARDMVAELVEAPTRENARRLVAMCMKCRSGMSGRYGNVREQFTRLMDAAKLFDRASVDLTNGRYWLERALGSIDIAIGLHKNWPKSAD